MFFQTPFYFSFVFLGNTSLKILRPIPLPPFSVLFASIWDSFLAQTSVLLLCQYAATLSRGKDSDVFLGSGPFQNFHKFFQELFGLNNLCEIL